MVAAGDIIIKEKGIVEWCKKFIRSPSCLDINEVLHVLSQM
jgi:hypothetical protein